MHQLCPWLAVGGLFSAKVCDVKTGVHERDGGKRKVIPYVIQKYSGTFVNRSRLHGVNGCVSVRTIREKNNFYGVRYGIFKAFYEDFSIFLWSMIMLVLHLQQLIVANS